MNENYCTSNYNKLLSYKTFMLTDGWNRERVVIREKD